MPHPAQAAGAATPIDLSEDGAIWQAIFKWHKAANSSFATGSISSSAHGVDEAILAALASTATAPSAPTDAKSAAGSDDELADQLDVIAAGMSVPDSPAAHRNTMASRLNEAASRLRAAKSVAPAAVAEVVDMKYNSVKFLRKNEQGDTLPYLQPGTKLYTAPMPAAPSAQDSAAPLSVSAEPIYQITGFGCNPKHAWRDATKEAFDIHSPDNRRIVYATAPAAPSSVSTEPASDEQLYRRVVSYEGLGVTSATYEPVAAGPSEREWLKCDACGNDMRGHDRMGHCTPPAPNASAFLATPSPAVSAEPVATKPICVWSYVDDDTGAWETSCGNLFSFTDGGPKENDFKHCCYCGDPMRYYPTAREAIDSAAASHPKESAPATQDKGEAHER